MADVLKQSGQDFEDRMKRLGERRGRLRQMVGTVFEPDVHYDRMQRCGKPKLLRAGADEALNLFGVAVDLDGQVVTGDGVSTPHIAVLIKAQAKDGDKVVAVAYGGANSFEEPFSSPQPWKLQDKIIDLASDRAVISLALSFGLGTIFALSDGIDSCVQAIDPGKGKGYALPDNGGSIPTAAAPTATGSPLTPYLKDDAQALQKKVDPVASLNLTGDARKDLPVVVKLLASYVGTDPGDLMLELSSFTTESGEKVPGFREVSPRRSDRWISSTLTKAKKRLQEVGIVSVVSETTF